MAAGLPEGFSVLPEEPEAEATAVGSDPNAPPPPVTSG
eukprot:gene8732-7944_t